MAPTFRPAVRAAVALLLAFAASGCTLLRDYSTYQRLLAHESEFAQVEIARYDLCVALQPELRRVHVVAGVTLHNGRARPLERVRFLLHPEAELGALRCAGLEIDHVARVERIADVAALAVEITGFPPVDPGGECELQLEYSIAPSAWTLGIRLEADHGYLLLESLWAPRLRTPLSTTGMDRAPLALEVTLPAPLEPIGLPEFELVGEGGGARTYRGNSDFPFGPFLAYGSFARSESPDGRVRVDELDGGGPERPTTFVLAALSELRAHFESAFGPVDLPTTKLAVVRRFGGSWGAPCCILLDEGSWPRESWREPMAFELLAHEMAHTWWGSSVALHGRGGYLHEGLANWCAADAARARYGAEAAERAFEAWLVRYARGEEPLDRPLADLSVLEDATWQRGAYLVGAHFYRALCERLGRERFVALLRRFHAEHAFRSADFDDLRAVARRECGSELEDLFETWVDSARGGARLFARGRELIDARTAAWRAREPAPDAELCARVEVVLAQAFERASGTDIAARHPSERYVMAPELFGVLNAMPELQVTVIDAAGDLVFHAEGLTGNVLAHRDVRGESVYGAILADGRGEGSLSNFDFLSADLRAARENHVAWRRLGPLAIVVEGHEWRSLE